MRKRIKIHSIYLFFILLPFSCFGSLSSEIRFDRYFSEEFRVCRSMTPYLFRCISVPNDLYTKIYYDHTPEVDYISDFPLHFSCWNGDIESALKLIFHKHKIDLKDDEGYTPFLCACANIVRFEEDTIDLCLQNGADISSKTKQGLSALHIASIRGNVRTVEKLLSLGCFIDVEDDSLRTPLHHAVINNRTTIVELLISNGANPTRETDLGKNALDITMNKPDKSMATLICRLAGDSGITFRSSWEV